MGSRREGRPTRPSHHLCSLVKIQVPADNARLFHLTFFQDWEKITKDSTRRIMTLPKTVSSIEFNRTLILRKSKVSPGPEWHQATMWGAHLPRKAGWGLPVWEGARKRKEHWTGSMCPSLSRELFCMFSHCIFTTVSAGRMWYPYTTQEDTEAQRSSHTWPRSHGLQEVGSRREPKCGWIQAFLLLSQSTLQPATIWGGGYGSGHSL